MPTCPYHNKPSPCPDCQAKNMGKFAWDGPYRGSAAPAYDLAVPSAHPHGSHTHGTTRPCHLRCGVNEGIYVRNNQPHVLHIYTDNLVGCAQVILRNATATFTCHIVTSATFPINFMLAACDVFRHRYGAVAVCYVISAADNPALGNRINDWLGPKLSLVVNRVTDCGGYAININNGTAGATPGTWNTSRDYVGGWLTAQNLIDLRIVGPVSIGAPAPGDYFEGCGLCRNLFDH